jgi:benzoate membrane transport protein
VTARHPVEARPDEGSAAAYEHLNERPVRPLPGPRRLLRDAGTVYATNGLIGLVFTATGPVAVILAVGTQGGLSEEQLASWIFGAFFLNGLLTVVACWLYR